MPRDALQAGHARDPHPAPPGTPLRTLLRVGRTHVKLGIESDAPRWRARRRSLRARCPEPENVTNQSKRTPGQETIEAAKHATASRPFTKVYWSEEEKRVFQEEAASHGQNESAYARFILSARKDPLLFLHMCRLRDPGFAAGLMGNASDAGKAAELENKLLRASHENEALTRERDEFAHRAEDTEQRLQQATDRARDLATRVVELSRLLADNRERALEADASFEGEPDACMSIVRALSVQPRLKRKDLEARLTENEGFAPEAAKEAVQVALRLGLVVHANGGTLKLATPPSDPASDGSVTA